MRNEVYIDIIICNVILVDDWCKEYERRYIFLIDWKICFWCGEFKVIYKVKKRICGKINSRMRSDWFFVDKINFLNFFVIMFIWNIFSIFIVLIINMEIKVISIMECRLFIKLYIKLVGLVRDKMDI